MDKTHDLVHFKKITSHAQGCHLLQRILNEDFFLMDIYIILFLMGDVIE